MALATFGAGCFWGVEYFFKQVSGVSQARCGYMGGEEDSASYAKIKQGNTGHAEVVQVEFDPKIVSYDALLAVFWSNHNPTTINQQGEDYGHQYRSVIFYHDDAQQQLAEGSRQQLAQSGKWGDKSLVTQILPRQAFHLAEEYHQNYLQRNNLPSCHISF